jgi:hypothetical protein
VVVREEHATTFAMDRLYTENVGNFSIKGRLVHKPNWTVKLGVGLWQPFLMK